MTNLEGWGARVVRVFTVAKRGQGPRNVSVARLTSERSSERAATAHERARKWRACAKPAARHQTQHKSNSPDAGALLSLRLVDTGAPIQAQSVSLDGAALHP